MSQTSSYSGPRRRPHIVLAVPGDDTIFVSGDYRSERADGKPANEPDIRVRLSDRQGFIPGWIIEKAVRWLEGGIRNENDPRVTDMGNGEFLFESHSLKPGGSDGPADIIATKFENGVAIKAFVRVRNGGRHSVVTVELSSIIVREIKQLMKVASGALVFFSSEGEDPANVTRDEKEWLEAPRATSNGHVVLDDNDDEDEDEVEALESQPTSEVDSVLDLDAPSDRSAS